MALVIPYGDPNAHGTIGKILTFRRYRSKVVLQKTPYPKQPNTPAQIARRNKFRAGWVAWHSLTAWELEYFEAKAQQQGTTASNLFMSLYLFDLLPSTIPMNLIKEITNLDLPMPVAPEVNGIKHELVAITDNPIDELSLGFTWDNENIFSSGSIAGPYTRLALKIVRTIVTPLTIPLDYPLLLWWKNFSDIEQLDLTKYPIVPFPRTVTPTFTQMKDIKRIVDLKVVVPAAAIPLGTRFNFLAQGGVHGSQQLGFIYDTQNIFTYVGDAVDYDTLQINVHNFDSVPFNAPDGYEIKMSWVDKNDLDHYDTIVFPAFALPPVTGTDFWMGDDISLYYNSSCSSLAKASTRTDTYILWVADDFSLYWDSALTQLASTPFY